MADTTICVLFAGIYSGKHVIGAYSALETAKTAAEEVVKSAPPQLYGRNLDELVKPAEINGWEDVGVDGREATKSRWESTTADPDWSETYTIEEYVLDEEAKVR